MNEGTYIPPLAPRETAITAAKYIKKHKSHTG